LWRLWPSRYGVAAAGGGGAAAIVGATATTAAAAAASDVAPIRQVSAFIQRQSTTGLCGDAIVFNFENPSLHGHGAQVRAPTARLPFNFCFTMLATSFQILFRRPGAAGALTLSCGQAGACDEARAGHQRQRTVGIQQVCVALVYLKLAAFRRDLHVSLL